MHRHASRQLLVGRSQHGTQQHQRDRSEEVLQECLHAALQASAQPIASLALRGLHANLPLSSSTPHASCSSSCRWASTHHLRRLTQLHRWRLQGDVDVIALALVCHQPQLASEHAACLHDQGLLQHTPQLEPAVHPALPCTGCSRMASQLTPSCAAIYQAGFHTLAPV